MQRINITLPDDLAEDFRRAIPARKRSQFIADQIKQNIATRDFKKELVKSLKDNYKLYKEEGKIWDATISDGLDK